MTQELNISTKYFPGPTYIQGALLIKKLDSTLAIPSSGALIIQCVAGLAAQPQKLYCVGSQTILDPAAAIVYYISEVILH